MPLYDPPLQLRKTKNWKTTSQVTSALEGLEVDYFYSGKRLGNKLVELEVITVLKDNEDNLFIRHCQYSGNKEKWKEVIGEQLKSHLRDLGVEEGFVKSETRFFEVRTEKHLDTDKFENRKREYIHNINTKNG